MKLFLIFALFSGSVCAAEFSCTSTLNGKELRSEKVEVTEDVTEIDLGTYKDIEIFGQAVQGQVSAFMSFDGVLYGSISMNAASYTMYMINEGELTLSCSLDDKVLP